MTIPGFRSVQENVDYGLKYIFSLWSFVIPHVGIVTGKINDFNCWKKTNMAYFFVH